MRGGDDRSGALFSYVDLEARIPKKHPLRAIRTIVNQALADMNAEFEAMYSRFGRPRLRPRSFCGFRCCRRSIRSARNAN